MSNIAIQVENLSKAYQLGEIGTGTISRDIERWWAKMRGKEDPFLRIGETNDRTAKSSENDVVWSLKDINFEIEQGQAVGIIGRNGAGKSTLLKILSRVTSPTTGSIKLKGRVASLLEVGTGFHPELTGRENIFLNGAILGMRKAEIIRKFDEIVDFAGVERYIDTPVKRYSSGMYVRLAFAVAAHLESEILIVDEVLAVGDAEFQKKCLGKMGDVSSKEGRTVLFVSHNMGAVKSLCQTGILLKNGEVDKYEGIDVVINNYLKLKSKNNNFKTVQGTQQIKIENLLFLNNSKIELTELILNEEVIIEMHCIAFEKLKNIEFAVCFNNQQEVRVLSIWSAFEGKSYNVENGKFIVQFIVPSFRLLQGDYSIVTYINWGQTTIERIDNYKEITVSDYKNISLEKQVPNNLHGFYNENFSSQIIY